jgi:hypothetical protein
MKNERLFHIMQSPGSMTQEDTDSLYDLIKVFPCFQTAHILLLYNLYQTNSEKFDLQLRDSAIFVGDRKILFNFIHNISKSQLPKPGEKNQAMEEPVQPLKTTQELLDFDDSAGIEDVPAQVVDFDINTDIIKPDAIEDSNEIMEFTEDEPVIEAKQSASEKSPEAVLSPNDLIELFIDKNPAFTPNKIDLSDQHEDISEPSIQEPEELATETLALIYTSQKLFGKAISVYEKLILKFPEKSTYFASRIEDLRKNIN